MFLVIKFFAYFILKSLDKEYIFCIHIKVILLY